MKTVVVWLLRYLGKHQDVIEAGATFVGKIIEAHDARKATKP